MRIICTNANMALPVVAVVAAVDMVNEKGAKDIRTDLTELIRQLCQDLPGGAQA